MVEPPPPYRRPELPFERKRSRLFAAGRWSVIGLEFGLAVVVFFLGGMAVDGYLRTTKPWMAVVGAMIGVAVGTWLMVRALLRTLREGDPKRNSPGGSAEDEPDI